MEYQIFSPCTLGKNSINQKYYAKSMCYSAVYSFDLSSLNGTVHFLFSLNVCLWMHKLLHFSLRKLVCEIGIRAGQMYVSVGGIHHFMCSYIITNISIDSYGNDKKSKEESFCLTKCQAFIVSIDSCFHVDPSLFIIHQIQYYSIDTIF